MDNSEISIVKTAEDITVSIDGIAYMQCCGNNLRGKLPRIRIDCNSNIQAAARLELIWTSLSEKTVAFEPNVLKLANLPVFLPLNTEVKLKKLKFPKNFGNIKKELGEKLGIKIKDSRKEANEFKQNFGFRVIVNETIVDCEKMFCLSHTKELDRNSKSRRNKKAELEQVETFSNEDISRVDETQEPLCPLPLDNFFKTS